MNKTQVQHRAAKLNIQLIDEGDVIGLICPVGQRLVGTQVHIFTMPVYYADDPDYNKANAWADLYAEMNMGIECCSGCEECS